MIRGWKYKNKETDEILQVLFNVDINGAIAHRMQNIKTAEIVTLTDEQMVDYERIMPVMAKVKKC